MASIGIEIVRKRETDMKNTIRRSSPALVYSGNDGIHIIASHRPGQKRKSRVYRILDRIAFVPRGSIEGCARLAEHAIIEGEKQGMSTSRGYVFAEQIARGVGDALSQTYHNYLARPLSVEGVVLKLESRPEDDEILYVDVEGEYRQVERAFFLGSWKIDSTANDEGAKIDALQSQLSAHWEPAAGFERILEIFRGLPALQENEELQRAFESPRVEKVLLDRSQLESKNWRAVFRRPN